MILAGVRTGVWTGAVEATGAMCMTGAVLAAASLRSASFATALRRACSVASAVARVETRVLGFVDRAAASRAAVDAAAASSAFVASRLRREEARASANAVLLNFSRAAFVAASERDTLTGGLSARAFADTLTLSSASLAAFRLATASARRVAVRATTAALGFMDGSKAFCAAAAVAFCAAAADVAASSALSAASFVREAARASANAVLLSLLRAAIAGAAGMTGLSSRAFFDDAALSAASVARWRLRIASF